MNSSSTATAAQPLFCIDVVHGTAPDNEFKTVAKRDEREAAMRCAREYIDGAKAVRVRYYKDGSGTPEVIHVKRPSGMNGGVAARQVHIMLSSVHMRRPGISDLQRNNGVKVKAQWVLVSEGGSAVLEASDIVYTSTAKNTREEAEELARKWLAKHPEFTEAK